MKKVEKKRDAVINKYVSLTQAVFLLFFVILLLREPTLSFESYLGNLPRIFSFVLLLATIPALLVMSSQQTPFSRIFDHIINCTYLLAVSYFLTYERNELFKVLLFMPTMVSGIKYGLRTALIYGFITFGCLCAVGYSDSFISLDADIMFGSVLLLMAWLLGSMTATESETRDELSRMASCDGLTGVYNHRSFHDLLDEEIGRAKNGNRIVALILLDIDDFKIYNDAFGHQEGDHILKQIADLLVRTVGTKGYAARYGGEEFAVVLPNTTSVEARNLAENLRVNIEKHAFSRADMLPGGKLTASIGVALYPINADSRERLVKKADEALYKAKYVSKNKVEIYNSTFDDMAEILGDNEQEILKYMQTLTMVINAKDRYTYGHSLRTMELAENLAMRMGLHEEEVTNISYGALLHDIGKVEIPREILNKPNRLSDQEWEIMRQHPQWGADIVKELKSFEGISDIVLYHHENYDGSGYPLGKADDTIPIGARILRVIDSYDAMTTKRPYREPLSKKQALEELTKCAGKCYDPLVVDNFVEMVS